MIITDRITISSGEGEQRIRYAVDTIRGQGATGISMEVLMSALRQMKDWARNTYPDRKDWVVMAIEELPHMEFLD